MNCSGAIDISLSYYIYKKISSTRIFRGTKMIFPYNFNDIDYAIILKINIGHYIYNINSLSLSMKFY